MAFKQFQVNNPSFMVEATSCLMCQTAICLRLKSQKCVRHKMQVSQMELFFAFSLRVSLGFIQFSPFHSHFQHAETICFAAELFCLITVVGFSFWLQ